MLQSLCLDYVCCAIKAIVLISVLLFTSREGFDQLPVVSEAG